MAAEAAMAAARKELADAKGARFSAQEELTRLDAKARASAAENVQLVAGQRNLEEELRVARTQLGEAEHALNAQRSAKPEVDVQAEVGALRQKLAASTTGEAALKHQVDS